MINKDGIIFVDWNGNSDVIWTNTVIIPGTTMTFHWVDGSYVTLVWSPNEPGTTGDRECTQLWFRYTLLGDLFCHLRMEYVCEKPTKKL